MLNSATMPHSGAMLTLAALLTALACAPGLIRALRQRSVQTERSQWAHWVASEMPWMQILERGPCIGEVVGQPVFEWLDVLDARGVRCRLYPSETKSSLGLVLRAGKVAYQQRVHARPSAPPNPRKPIASKVAGFTLVELMVVVAVIGILTAVAVPAYNTYVTESKLPPAFSALMGLGQSLETYYQDNKTYVGACQPGAEASLPTSQDFTFSCPSLTAGAWRVQATGDAGTAAAGFAFTLDSQGNRATISTPAGWTAQPSCWTRDKSGDCSA